MTGELVLAGPAARALKRMPAADRRRILAAFDAMEQDPFSGDIVRLTAQPVAWRRRVGNWRVLFDVELGRAPRPCTRRHQADIHNVLRGRGAADSTAKAGCSTCTPQESRRDFRKINRRRDRLVCF